MIIQKPKTRSLRIDPDNPDSPLYLRNGIRRSLRTKDRGRARHRRGPWLAGLNPERGAV